MSVATVVAPARPKADTMSTRCPAQVKRTAVTAKERNDSARKADLGTSLFRHDCIPQASHISPSDYDREEVVRAFYQGFFRASPASQPLVSPLYVAPKSARLRLRMIFRPPHD